MLYNQEWDKADPILMKAADLIEKHGHVKGHPGSEELGYCAIGAICAADFSFDGMISIPNMFSRIDLLAKVVSSLVPRWNDAPERTKEEVIAALRLAAVAFAKETV